MTGIILFLIGWRVSVGFCVDRFEAKKTVAEKFWLEIGLLFAWPGLMGAALLDFYNAIVRKESK